jgi:hypothetical protein
MQALTNQNTNNKPIQLNGQSIEWVENFKYLGSMMLSSTTDIKVRKGQAWKVFWKMKNICKLTTILIHLKINIFKASCLSILLYGWENWIITNKLESTLNSFATSCFRIMLGIKRLDTIQNKHYIWNSQTRTLNTNNTTSTTTLHWSLPLQKYKWIYQHVCSAHTETCPWKTQAWSSTPKLSWLRRKTDQQRRTINNLLRWWWCLIFFLLLSFKLFNNFRWYYNRCI